MSVSLQGWGASRVADSRLVSRNEAKNFPLFRRADDVMMPEAKTCGEHHCNSRGLADRSASKTRVTSCRLVNLPSSVILAVIFPLDSSLPDSLTRGL
jgi:hypothetical protein